jgi:hypothetical protein
LLSETDPRLVVALRQILSKMAVKSEETMQDSSGGFDMQGRTESQVAVRVLPGRYIHASVTLPDPCRAVTTARHHASMLSAYANAHCVSNGGKEEAC